MWHPCMVAGSVHDVLRTQCYSVSQQFTPNSTLMRKRGIHRYVLSHVPGCMANGILEIGFCFLLQGWAVARLVLGTRATSRKKDA